MTQLLLTGFGPFEGFDTNPSRRLVERSGCDHEVLEVSYAGTSAFFESLDSKRFQTLLMIGAHGSATKLKLEMLAHNWIGPSKDVRGHAPIGKIQDGSRILAGTLWNSLSLENVLRSEPIEKSFHAGSYLCNYVYYRALSLFPDKRVGFLHVPSEGTIPLKDQEKALKKLVQLVEDSTGSRK